MLKTFNEKYKNKSGEAIVSEITYIIMVKVLKHRLLKPDHIMTRYYSDHYQLQYGDIGKNY